MTDSFKHQYIIIDTCGLGPPSPHLKMDKNEYCLLPTWTRRFFHQVTVSPSRTEQDCFDINCSRSGHASIPTDTVQKLFSRVLYKVFFTNVSCKWKAYTKILLRKIFVKYFLIRLSFLERPYKTLLDFLKT